MKHIHAEMIIAKANNMDLVVLSKFGDSEWIESSVDYSDSFNFLKEFKYFPCLPEHKDVCLHWLNGGESQYLSNGICSWINFGGNKFWVESHLFMTNECELRIKPRKEKRWIAVTAKSDSCFDMLFISKEDAIEFIAAFHPNTDINNVQFIEIEVEV